MAALTPMMQQYRDMKEKHPDALLFFRLGDFYEMFFEDAEIASKVLGIALTSRSKGKPDEIPMCGVPYHSVSSYLKKLIENGYKVAICEQLTDPALSKGLVERDVVRVVTPGTVIEENMIDDTCNNYILSIYIRPTGTGLAWCDVSTGEFYTQNLPSVSVDVHVSAAILQISPAEIIADGTTFSMLHAAQIIGCKVAPTHVDDSTFVLQAAKEALFGFFSQDALTELRLEDSEDAVCAAGALVQYLNQTQKIQLAHINRVIADEPGNYMELDGSTRRNLELTKSIMSEGKKGTLLWVLDRTKTSHGTRILRKWLDQPLQSVQAIQMRLDSVEELYQNYTLRTELQTALKGIHDVERLCSKLSYSTIHARDAVDIKETLFRLPKIKQLLMGCSSTMLSSLGQQLDPMEALAQEIDAMLADSPPLSVKEGDIIKDGFHEEVDRLRYAHKNGRELLATLESREREATGIKNLKIGFNKVFGYYIEVTKSQYDLVPYRYVRKQTLANCERFITEELKQLEDTILGAEERCIRLEYMLFTELRDKMYQQMKALQQAARIVAVSDALQSLATAAFENKYVRPTLNTEGRLSIQEGRHPVVEQTVKRFVPNSTLVDGAENRLMILTGPNMAGKSTYMRQVAMITLMAHIGSFVSAKEADICIVDRIFTRVGASDDLASGRSTFMVEMSETANILQNATDKSLIILDELGRGTSTFDGLSIAWAASEYICNQVGAKTLFATHYHELSELEGLMKGVKNYCILAKEAGEDVVFLHRIARGGTDKSFGIQVAKLAGVPREVTERAQVILKQLRELDVDGYILRAQDAADVSENQIETCDAGPYQSVIEQLREADISLMTPLDALNLLNKLHEEVSEQ